MTHCPRCGKAALQPDAVHTCTPRALVLADALRTRCRLSESCLPEAEYRTRLTALHDEMLTEIEKDTALLRQALEALELCAVLVHDGNRQGDTAIEAASAAITALRARLNHTEKS